VQSELPDGSELRCISPPGAGAAADLEVTSPAGALRTAALYAGLLAFRRPSVAAVEPSKAAPGDTLTVRGADFGASDPRAPEGAAVAATLAVTVGGAAICAKLTPVSDAELRCEASRDLQSGAVVVQVAGRASLPAACPGAAGGCLARAEAPVRLSLSLALDFAAAGAPGSPARAAFEADVVADVAAAARAPPARFRVAGVRAGSVIVDLDVAPGLAADSPSPAALAVALAAQAADPGSALRAGAVTAAVAGAALSPQAEDALRLEQAAAARAAGGDGSYEDACPRLATRGACLECCAYQCETQGGPSGAPPPHPGQVAALCLRQCSAHVCTRV
jgi:hypothetical protein